MNVGAGWFLTVIRSPVLKNKTLEGNKFFQILGVTSILKKKYINKNDFFSRVVSFII